MSKHIHQPIMNFITAKGTCEITLATEAKKKVKLVLPVTGIYENDPKKRLTKQDAQKLADRLHDLLEALV